MAQQERASTEKHQSSLRLQSRHPASFFCITKDVGAHVYVCHVSYVHVKVYLGCYSSGAVYLAFETGLLFSLELTK